MTRPADPLAPLLARYFATGDAAAMEEFVRRTRPRLLRAAARAVARSDAEDAVQAAYHALLRRGALPPEVSPTGWLVTTVVRTAWRARARALRFAAVTQRLGRGDDEPGPVENAQRAEEADRVRAAIAGLPPKYRDPLVLHHLHGLSVAELQRLTGLPGNTIKTRLRRGRALLERRLAPAATWTLALAWGLLDVLRPATIAGGAMKAKTAIGVGLLALTFGATGYVLGDRGPRRTDTRAARETTARDPVLGKTAEPATAPEPDRPPEPGKAPAAPPVDRTKAFLRSIESAARELGASPEAVRRAHMALMAANGLATARRSGNSWEDHHLAEVQAAVDSLGELGDEGFAAMIAFARAARSKALADLLARLCPPGSEARLIRDATDPQRGAITRLTFVEALARLGRDVPGADAALRDIVGRTEHALLFAAAVDAAAARSVALDVDRIARKLRDPKFRRVHTRLLRALGNTGDEHASRVLRELARDAAFPLPGPALAALARIEPQRAARLAAVALDGPRELPAMQRARLRVVAGRW